MTILETMSHIDLISNIVIRLLIIIAYESVISPIIVGNDYLKKYKLLKIKRFNFNVC